MLCVKCGREIRKDVLFCDSCGTEAKIDAIVDEKGNTALMAASAIGNIGTVKSLISAGADVNARNQDSKTPLMRACYYGHADVAKVLIDAGADVEARCDKENTPLIYATAKGNLDVSKVLVNEGVNVNDKTSTGFNALMCASQKGEVEMVDLLIKWGADVNAKNDSGHLMAKNGEEKERDDPTLYNTNEFESGNTALMSAAKRGHIKIVELLIRARANVHAKDHNEHTALMLAEFYGHKDIVRLLKEAESYSNPRLYKMFVILGVVCVFAFVIQDPFELRSGKDNQSNIVEQVEVDINSIVDIRGSTALIVAAKNGDLSEVRILIERGANVNAADRDGITALGYATENGYTEIIELLTSLGAK